MKTFQKKTEDFTCEKCGFLVLGNGYTNHCPKCLYSKHVDIYPGDRGAICQGLMEPVDGGKDDRGEFIIHQCVDCGHKKRNKLSMEDAFDAFVTVIKKKNEKVSQ